jgi:hypothetical protein
MTDLARGLNWGGLGANGDPLIDPLAWASDAMS